MRCTRALTFTRNCFLVAVLLAVALRTVASSSLFDEFFYVSSLGDANSKVVSASSSAGDYGSASLALSSSSVVFSGDEGFVMTFNKTQLQAQMVATSSVDAVLLSDLSSQQLYVLEDSNGDILTEPGYATSLRLVSDVSFIATSTIALSQKIYVGLGSAVFSGVGEGVLVDGDSGMAYRVSLSSGNVYEEVDVVVRWQPSF